MKIYTRTGDRGTTTLFTGERVHKNNAFIEALGAVDEGNSAVGVALSCLPSIDSLKTMKQQLETIQHALFDVGAALATPLSKASDKKLEKTRFGHEAITRLENRIDEMEKELPPLHCFILPGGHPAGASLHLARSIIRRAERDVTQLYESGEVVQDVFVYLNRLSDYLFVASRFVNHITGTTEIEWQPHKESI